MKLSLVFELLLIFILLAFAAQAKSTRKQKNNHKKGIQNRNDAEKPEDNTINKYCKCQEAFCNCCRNFDLPVINLNGPGCASLRYLSGDKMAVSLSFGKKVITNRTLSSKKPSPVCMPLPGGISKFCGRVYNIARAGEEFRACLGLELQSKSAVEAAVRVSCFKFGPRGVTSEQADPLPLVPQNEKEDDDDDDDDDDDVDFDLGEDDDDDDDDDAATNDVESADYTGFSLLSEDLLGGLFGTSSNKKPIKNRKKQAPAPTPSTTTTLSTTTRRPRPSRRPSRRPTKSTTPKTVPNKPSTVRVKPSGNRRPTRKPARRPTRRPTTNIASENTILSTLPMSSTEAITAGISSSTQTPLRNDLMSSAHDQTFEPIAFGTQKPASTLAATTVKSVTNFEDPGLEMSLAHITGQLSVMPAASQISPDTGKDSDLAVESDQMNYEKIETITKVSSTVPLVTPVPNSDEMIQIVTRLDSDEQDVNKDQTAADESRAHFMNTAVPNDFYGGLSLKQKKKGRHNDYDLDDLDVLNFDQIGKTVGEELGIFGKNKKRNRNNNKNNNNKKIRDGKKDDDYSVIGLDSLESLIGINNGKQNKKNRRRQNKMMRGEWSQAQV